LSNPILINAIHLAQGKGVIITTGGGTGAFPMLMAPGGASNTILSLLVPYDARETAQLLGQMPNKLVSTQAARQLCAKAYQRAGDLCEELYFGIGATAVLQRTPEEREGRVHEIIISGQNSEGLCLEYHWSRVGTGQVPSVRRLGEEELMSNLIVLMVASLKGVETQLSAHFAEMGPVQIKEYHHDSETLTAWEVWDQKPVEDICWEQDPPMVLMPGSFNPVHAGHLQMMTVAEQMLGKPVALELCVANVDKAPLSFLEEHERLEGIARSVPDGTRIFITRAPRFMDKANLFPCALFVVGYDTATRIVDPKYADLSAVQSTFERLHTRFLVFGRQTTEGFQCSHQGFPEFFRDIAVMVPEAVFRSDVSSTQLREAL
jgi:hypothetical protein